MMRMKLGRLGSAARTAVDPASNATTAAMATTTNRSAKVMRRFLQESLELCEALLHPRFEFGVAVLVLVAVLREVQEQLHHVSPVGEVDVFRADLAFCLVHVVVVAQRHADAGGGEAVDVVDG